MVKKILVLTGIILSVFVGSALAGKGEIVFVETAVDIQPVGKAVVAYSDELNLSRSTI